MRTMRAAAGLLLACALAACGAAALPTGSLALGVEAPLHVAAGTDGGTLEVVGLRFRGCPQRSLSVLLFDGADELTESALSSESSAGVPLDFDRMFDRASDSWVLHITLSRSSGTAAATAAAPRPTRLQLWCRACRSAAEGGAEVSGLLASHSLGLPALPVEGGTEQAEPAAATAGAAPNTSGSGTVVLLLQHAVLPALPALPTAADSSGSGSSITAGAASTAATAAARRRRLQQGAGGGDCTVTVGGQARSFASCLPVTSSNGYSLVVHATVEADGAGGSKLRMGMVSSSSDRSYAGWGLPKTADLPMMFGASAVMMWPSASSPTGAEVDGFLLPDFSYDQKDVNKARGTFPISDAAAEAEGDEVRAVFTISLPKVSAAKAAAPGGTSYIYALGPTGTSTPPGLGDHSIGKWPFGFGTFKMKQAGGAVPAAPPAATVPMPVAPTGQTEGVDEEGGEREDGHEDEHKHEHNHEHEEEDGDEEREKPSVSGVPAAPAVPAGAACTLQMATDGTPQLFSGCTLVSGVGSNFWLMWKLAPSPSNPAKTVLTMALNASSTSGYVAVGFPSVPTRMVGASSLVLAPCAAAGSAADCPSGARLTQYYLAGETTSTVIPDSRLSVTNIQAAALPSGHLAGSFDIEVDLPAAGRRRRSLLLLQDGLSMPLIFAAGPTASDGSPLRHITDGDAAVPVLDTASTGAGAATQGGGSTSDDDSLKAAHAWLTAIGWGVLIPVGIAMARSFKDARPPLWFHLHRALQALGFALGTVGLGLGFALVDGWEAESEEHAVHRNLGVACTALGATQFTALVLRPKPGAKYRLAWQLWHAWVGRAAAAVAIANIYYGILHMWELGAWAWASYTAVLAAIVCASLGKDAADFLRKRRGAGGQGTGVQLTRPPSQAPPSSPPRHAATASSDVEAPILTAAVGAKASTGSLSGISGVSGKSGISGTNPHHWSQ